jgi:hypothetical protein
LNIVGKHLLQGQHMRHGCIFNMNRINAIGPVSDTPKPMATASLDHARNQVRIANTPDQVGTQRTRTQRPRLVGLQHALLRNGFRARIVA